MEPNENQENMSPTPQGQQRRKLAYRDLLSRTEMLDESGSVGLEAAREIGVILQQANSLNDEVRIEERVHNADETLLDCKVVSSASNILKKCVQSVDVFTTTYEPEEFADKLRMHMIQKEDCQVPDFRTLLDEARLIVREVPAEAHVYGAYDLNQVPVPKQKKLTQKAPLEKLQKKEAEKVVSLDKEEERIEEIVKTMYSVLDHAYKMNQQSPINYYDYIVDTDSFGGTIENMFYFSFLIRDGKAALDLDSQGVPVIKPMKKQHGEQFKADGSANSQLISCFNMDTWEKYTKAGLLQRHKGPH